jgi:iron complex transport system substrate-binding protein
MIKKLSIILFIILFWGQVLPDSLWAVSDLEVYNRRVIPKEYQRIVSLAPNITEILFVLGLGDRVIGVTQHCNYPKEALTKTSIGSYIDLNIEKILALKPDLVIATADGNEKGSVERLAAFKVPVLVTNPKSLNEVFEVVKTIGHIVKQEDRAENLVRSLKNRANRVIQVCVPLSRPRVFLQINEHPLITVGKDTFHNNLIKLVGGINISGQESIKYPKYSLEQVLRSRPDVILITTMERGVAAEKKKERWIHWDQIPAVKQGRIYLLDSDLLDRPSPRLVDGLEALAVAIHPELGAKTKGNK